MGRRFGAVSSDENQGWALRLGSSADVILGSAADGDWANTPFAGAINGAPTNNGDGTYTLSYDGDSGKNSLAVQTVLHNTTRSTRAVITAHNRGANTITVEDGTPGDVSAWADNDAITTASQTNTGRTGVYVDVDVTDWVTADAVAIYLAMSGKDTGPAAGRYVLFHPLETYAASKELLNLEFAAAGHWLYATGFLPLMWANSRAYITFCVLGAAAATVRCNLRYGGEVL